MIVSPDNPPVERRTWRIEGEKTYGVDRSPCEGELISFQTIRENDGRIEE